MFRPSSDSYFHSSRCINCGKPSHCSIHYNNSAQYQEDIIYCHHHNTDFSPQLITTYLPATQYLNPRTTARQRLLLATCSISSFVKNGDNLLSTCCNTTDHIAVSPYTISISNDLVMTGGYSADDCDWTYCNVTGNSGVSTFESCVSKTAPEIEAQCFVAGKAQTSDSRRTSTPWKKTEKKTLSAGLLIALGVAGMLMG